MSKLLTTTLFLFTAFSAFAQQEYTEERDLLKQIEDLKRQISILERKVEKSNIKSLEAMIKNQASTIDSLLQVIEIKDTTIIANHNAAVEQARQNYNDGQQSVFEQISLAYRSETFDDLITSSVQFFVDRDSELLSSHQDSILMLNDLQKVFAAQQVLLEKYDEQLVANAIKSLNTIEQQSSFVGKLRRSLEDYQIRNDGLKYVINNIIDTDKDTTADNDNIQKLKRQEILGVLASYFWDYQFNFDDYPYLSDVILEIMKRKQRNADASVDDLLRKL